MIWKYFRASSIRTTRVPCRWGRRLSSGSISGLALKRKTWYLIPSISIGHCVWVKRPKMGNDLSQKGWQTVSRFHQWAVTGSKGTPGQQGKCVISAQFEIRLSCCSLQLTAWSFPNPALLDIERVYQGAVGFKDPSHLRKPCTQRRFMFFLHFRIALSIHFVP